MSDLIEFKAQLPADRNPALVYLNRLAISGRRAQVAALKDIVDLVTNGQGDYQTFAWHQLRFQHTEAIRTRLIDLDSYAPATINRFLSAMRGVLKMAWKLGLMSHEDYAAAASVENIKHQTLPAGRMLQSEEVRALLQVCLSDDTDTGVRDAAVIALMYATGARRSEVVKLQTGDFDIAASQIKIVYGKRMKSRTSYLGDNAKRHVINWLKIRGVAPGYLFAVINTKNTILINRPLHSQTLYDMLERRGKQVGLESFSAHDFRRTAISEMLDRGVDIATVAKIVGHDSLDTTRRYDRRDERSKQAATKVFDTPI